MLGVETTGINSPPKRMRHELDVGSPVSPLQLPASGKVPLGARSSSGNNGGGPSRKNKPQRCSICKEWGHKSRTCRLAPGKGACPTPLPFAFPPPTTHSPARPPTLLGPPSPTHTPPSPRSLVLASLSHPHLVSQRQSYTQTASRSFWTSSAKLCMDKAVQSALARPRSTLECIVATWRLVATDRSACTCIPHVALSKDRFGCVEANVHSCTVSAMHRNRFHDHVRIT